MEEKISKLRGLIKKSQSIDEDEKKSIINQLQHLKIEDINKMIEVFTWEQEQIAILYKKNQENIHLLKDYSKQSLLKIKKLKKELIDKTEHKVEKDEKMKAEKLLNNN